MQCCPSMFGWHCSAGFTLPAGWRETFSFSEAVGKDSPFCPHSPSPGALFQEFKEEMETVYKIYCASYERALLLVESYRKDPRLQEEILETLNVTV